MEFKAGIKEGEGSSDSSSNFATRKVFGFLGNSFPGNFGENFVSKLVARLTNAASRRDQHEVDHVNFLYLMRFLRR
jgi:hypothetical protein